MPVFHTIAAGVNGVAFPVGLAILIVVSHPLPQAMRRHVKNLPIDTVLALRARQTCLKLGNYAAVIGIALWSIAAWSIPLPSISPAREPSSKMRCTLSVRWPYAD